MRTKFLKKNLSTILYSCLYLGIFLLQAFYSQQSTSFITHEELAESVRNVWWLQNRSIYDGISSNVGWYALVQFAYYLFGFSLFTGKIVRLVLFALGLFCAFDLLLKYLDKKMAWMPILLLGLSPTLLYFNTLQTSFGVDVPYFLIVLWLFIAFYKSDNSWLLLPLGFIISLAALSYPSFLLYTPAIGILTFIAIYKQKQNTSRLLLIVLGFTLPILFFLLYLNNPNKLIFDQKVNSGIFRGGGTLPQSWSEAVENIKNGYVILYQDLFVLPKSYYFEAARSEFSHIFTRISVWLILILASIKMLVLLIHKKYRKILIPIVAFLSLTLGASLASISSWFPGLRRATIILLAFYALIAWLFKLWEKKKLNQIQKLVLITASLLILIHHFKVIPISVTKLKYASINAETTCFSILGSSPGASLRILRSHLKPNGLIDTTFIANTSECRLAEVYAALSGDCYWNSNNCPTLKWPDKNTNQAILLQTSLWDDYYFSH